MTDRTEIDAPVALLLNVISGDEAEALEHIEASSLRQSTVKARPPAQSWPNGRPGQIHYLA